MKKKELDRLLLAHIAEWMSDIRADNFVDRVNDSYAAYLAAGGSDEHCKANWFRLRAVYERSRAAAGRAVGGEK